MMRGASGVPGTEYKGTDVGSIGETGAIGGEANC